jgi:Fibronectin type III domain
VARRSRSPRPTSRLPPRSRQRPGGAEGEVNLSWEPSADAVGYVVFFATDPDGEPHPIYETTETTVTLGGLKSGVTHYFVVRAYTKAGESENSPQASAAAG